MQERRTLWTGGEPGYFRGIMAVHARSTARRTFALVAFVAQRERSIWSGRSRALGTQIVGSLLSAQRDKVAWEGFLARVRAALGCGPFCAVFLSRTSI